MRAGSLFIMEPAAAGGGCTNKGKDPRRQGYSSYWWREPATRQAARESTRNGQSLQPLDAMGQRPGKVDAATRDVKTMQSEARANRDAMTAQCGGREAPQTAAERRENFREIQRGYVLEFAEIRRLSGHFGHRNARTHAQRYIFIGHRRRWRRKES